MYADEKDLRSLYAITLAAFLLLSLKLGALVQYFQQTHHIFLDVNPTAATADWFNLTNDINAVRERINEVQLQAEARMMIAGQVILVGDEALPQPPPVKELTCPLFANQCESIAKPTENVLPKNTSVENLQPINSNTETEQQISQSVVAAQLAVENGQTDSTDINAIVSRLPETDTPIELEAGDKVLVVGDSMMQGLGPHIVSSLSRNNGVETVDLSRHSTGLAYPRYFDWPETILQQLQTQEYKVMLIFIGANDTWDIVINGRYTSFGNPKWIEVYTERVEKIILTAKTYNVRVIWLGDPPMGRDNMVDRIPVLNQIYESVAAKYPGVVRYVPTASTLTNDGLTFSKFIDIPSRGKVMVRTDDGVHFTANGQRLLAKLALSQLVLHPYDKKAQKKSLTVSSQASSVSPVASSNESSSSETTSSASSENISNSIKEIVSTQAPGNPAQPAESSEVSESTVNEIKQSDEINLEKEE